MADKVIGRRSGKGGGGGRIEIVGGKEEIYGTLKLRRVEECKTKEERSEEGGGCC